MVFSSISFLFYFLPVMLFIYFLAPRRWRNSALFVGSLFFYAWGEPVYILLMLFSILCNYTLGLLMERSLRAAGGDGPRTKERNSAEAKGRTAAKTLLITAVVINIGLLAFFKYADFFLSNLNWIPGVSVPLLKLPLPLGISFYTFQALSYVIDLYRGQVEVQKSFVAFGAYVSLFPQLIAGPIVRMKTVADELAERRETVDEFAEGVRRFVVGLGKKVLLANGVGAIFTQVSQMEPTSLSALTAWIGALAFTFQIYFDFSGYSDMAIGLGRMLGFHFLENFNYPYQSKSITEFWRRWHISLSTWFKEYVYIPLGGNRQGLKKQIRNILVVWLLTGFWHGASWNFVVWGLYFGTLLILEKLFLGRALERIPAACAHVYTMLLVIFSWVIFAFDSLGTGFLFLKAMLGGNDAGLWDEQGLYLLSGNLILFGILALGSTELPKRAVGRVRARFRGRELPDIVMGNAFLLIVFFLCVAYLVSSSYNPFLYFRF